MDIIYTCLKYCGGIRYHFSCQVKQSYVFVFELMSSDNSKILYFAF